MASKGAWPLYLLTLLALHCCVDNLYTEFDTLLDNCNGMAVSWRVYGEINYLYDVANGTLYICDVHKKVGFRFNLWKSHGILCEVGFSGYAVIILRNRGSEMLATLILST